jgi:hypothetical protein
MIIEAMIIYYSKIRDLVSGYLPPTLMQHNIQIINELKHKMRSKFIFAKPLDVLYKDYIFTIFA